MTPERAAYHYLMLSVGLRDAFDADFDAAVENEDPLSDLTVKLCAAPPSDTDACRSILMNYYCDYFVDSHAVFDLVLADVARRWRSGSLTSGELAALCLELAEEGDLPFPELGSFRAPWYCWDHANRNQISWDDFREDMELFFATGYCPHP